MSSNIFLNTGLSFPRMHSSPDSFDSYVIFLVSSRWKNKKQTSRCQQLHTHLCNFTWNLVRRTPPTRGYFLRRGLRTFAERFSFKCSFGFSKEDSKDISKALVSKQSGKTLTHSTATLFPTIYGRSEGLTAALFNVIREEWGTRRRKSRSCADLKEVAGELRRLSNYFKAESWKTSDGQIKNKCYRWERWNVRRSDPAHPCNLRGSHSEKPDENGGSGCRKIRTEKIK